MDTNNSGIYYLKQIYIKTKTTLNYLNFRICFKKDRQKIHKVNQKQNIKKHTSSIQKGNRRKDKQQS